MYDDTLDLTKDNCNKNAGFMRTNAGDIPLNVESSSKGDKVVGHVIFNQAENCVSRWNGPITGTCCQKFWV